MKIITEELLDELSGQARKSPRLRMNYNFHESMEASVHRLLNAVEPDTYIPPHRHKNPDKDESYIVLRGSLLTILFDDEGNITERFCLNPAEGRYGADIPAGTWHCVVVLEPGTIIYEVKPGPYAPITPENMASWAPAADDAEGIKSFIKRIMG